MCFAETVLIEAVYVIVQWQVFYKVWCNVEQKFVSGYFDTLPVPVQTTPPRYRCQQRLSDPSGNKLDNSTNATVSPASYAGDVQGRDLVAEETVSTSSPGTVIEGTS
jgi:hypothetical protein